LYHHHPQNNAAVSNQEHVSLLMEKKNRTVLQTVKAAAMQLATRGGFPKLFHT
jgi:hypothetical protein